MLTVPSRITPLIEKLEAGEQPTQEELKLTLQLQALDIARAGEEFLAQALSVQAEMDKKLEEEVSK